MAASHDGQFSLRIKLRDEARFANFHEGRNSAVVTRIQSWLAEPGPEPLLVCGDSGVGKSHLLNAACVLPLKNRGGTPFT